MLSDWPDWEDGKRELKVHIRTGGAFAAAVRAAMAQWNGCNAGWNLVETASAADADVSIGEGPVAPGNAGETTPTTESTGLFGLGSGQITSANVNVAPGMSNAERDRTIVHELGHCQRMDHTPGGSDVMHPSNTATMPSAKDKAEAKASDEDPPCPLAVSSYLVIGIPTVLSLIPKPGTGLTLEDVLDVEIEILTSENVIVDPDSVVWNADAIEASFFAGPDADHNEVFEVTLTRADGDTGSFTGVITVTDTFAPADALPHAVAGGDATVCAGEPVILDGRGSFHDLPDEFISGTWMTRPQIEGPATGSGLLRDYGQVVLPQGVHTAALQIRDQWGRSSIDEVTIRVVDCGPTGEPLPPADRPGKGKLRMERGSGGVM